MNKVEFVVWMENRWAEYAENCMDSFIEGTPHEAGGDFFRELETESELGSIGVEVIYDTEDYRLLFLLDDAILASPFTLGTRELETEWIPPMHEGEWLEPSIEDLKALNKRMADESLKLLSAIAKVEVRSRS